MVIFISSRVGILMLKTFDLLIRLHLFGDYKKVLYIRCGHTADFYHDLLTVYLGKLDFLSVTDFSLGNLPRGNFIVWVLDVSRKQ